MGTMTVIWGRMAVVAKGPTKGPTRGTTRGPTRGPTGAQLRMSWPLHDGGRYWGMTPSPGKELVQKAE